MTQVDWKVEGMERSVKKEGEPAKPIVTNKDYISKYANIKID